MRIRLFSGGGIFGKEPSDLLRGFFICRRRCIRIQVFIRIFRREDTVDLGSVRGNELCHRARANREDRVQLFHHQNVVKSLGTGQTEADVFKVADGVLLTVQIVGTVACIGNGNVGVFDTLSRFSARTGIDIGALALNLRRFLDAERMHRDVIGVQINDAVNGLGKALERFLGKTRDQVGIDVRNSGAACNIIRAQEILYRVPATD